MYNFLILCCVVMYCGVRYSKGSVLFTVLRTLTGVLKCSKVLHTVSIVCCYAVKLGRVLYCVYHRVCACLRLLSTTQ